MSTTAKIVASVVALLAVLLIFGGSMSPEKSKAYDLKYRADEFCKKAMEDAAPGAERRQTRAICDNLQAEAEKRIREAK